MDNVSPEKLRLFVAIPVPEEARTEMARVQDDLRRFAEANDIRWVDPAQFHLTLKFLGDVVAENVITLGRFQKFRRHKTEALLPHALSFGDHTFGKWTVDRIDLMQSVLSMEGARHTVLASAWVK